MGTANDVVTAAVQAEDEGWDGLSIPGSPLLVADPWVSMALASRETTRILFGTGLVTPIPEIAAALAGSSNTVQKVSGGRVVLGIGRGDLGAASLGMGQAPLPFFERYLVRLRSYVRGEQVPFDLALDGGGYLPPLDELGGPQTSGLALFMSLDDSLPMVPIEVFASGPKVMTLGGRHADRVTFAVGAETDRLAWAISMASQGAVAANRNLSELSWGAVIPICPHEDRNLGHALLAGAVGSMARFSILHGGMPQGVSARDRPIYEDLHRQFSRAGHFGIGGGATPVVPPEFIDRFAVVGPPDECVDRLENLVRIGINRFSLGIPAMGQSPDPSSPIHEIRHSVVHDVLPKLRARCASQDR